MIPSQGYIHLYITPYGNYSKGFINIKSDSLTTIDSIQTSNYSRYGKEFINIKLLTSGKEIIMYDRMWAIFNKTQENPYVFYQTKRIRN